VRDLLQQALDSLIDSADGFDYEIFVVDNASKDKTVDMVKAKYPQVKLIENQQNIGFSKANNQALSQAKGEYVLVINPDTITSEDTISKVITFMDAHQNAGGLGVRMINAQGKYLQESKRGLPTPLAAFTKFTGLSKLYPKSKVLNRYYMGWINEFDESFFMYGEDIDLSYRLTLAGYENYYFSDTYIIHFKGQSTRKLSWRYIQSFYGAMFIFVRKYFVKF